MDTYRVTYYHDEYGFLWEGEVEAISALDAASTSRLCDKPADLPAPTRIEVELDPDPNAPSVESLFPGAKTGLDDGIVLHATDEYVYVWSLEHEEGDIRILATGDSRSMCEVKACEIAVGGYNLRQYGPLSLKQILSAILDPGRGQVLRVVSE